MQIILSEEEAKVLRTIGAKINGTIGGLTKSENRARASRRNARKARKARQHAAAA